MVESGNVLVKDNEFFGSLALDVDSLSTAELARILFLLLASVILLLTRGGKEKGGRE